MYKQTKKDLLDDICKRWKFQYYEVCGNQWMKTYFVEDRPYEKEQIYNDLKKAKTIEEVEKIIGNRSWTRNNCYECGFDSDYEEVVFLESTEEYGPEPYCQGCLSKALELFKK